MGVRESLTQMRERKSSYKIINSENMKATDHLEDLGIDGRIIFELV
jgi:hypothetical protein